MPLASLFSMIYRMFLFILSSSPGHFLVNDLFTVSKQLAIRFQRNFTCVYSWVVCALQCKILLTSRLTLTFQGHNYIKSHFGSYLGVCWTNCCQILTQGSLGRGLSIDQKTSWAVWTWDVRERVTLAAIIQKDVLDHNFQSKALGMMILTSRYMFSRSRNLMVPFVLTYGLDLSRSWPLWNHVLGHISVLMGKMLPNFNTR